MANIILNTKVGIVELILRKLEKLELILTKMVVNVGRPAITLIIDNISKHGNYSQNCKFSFMYLAIW